MGVSMGEKTTITVSRETRRRLGELEFDDASATTAEEKLVRLIEEHERAAFQTRLAAIDPQEYQAAMREEGLWPGSDDGFAAEERILQAQDDAR